MGEWLVLSNTQRVNDITVTLLFMSSGYLVFCGICVTIFKELNAIVLEPYMVESILWFQLDQLYWLAGNLKDEPFHIPQAQAYCRGEFSTWDPKITTPPGLWDILFISSILHNRMLTSIALTPQLFVVLASETSVFVQLQRTNATAYDAIVLVVTSHCADAAFVLS